MPVEELEQQDHTRWTCGSNAVSPVRTLWSIRPYTQSHNQFPHQSMAMPLSEFGHVAWEQLTKCREGPKRAAGLGGDFQGWSAPA